MEEDRKLERVVPTQASFFRDSEYTITWHGHQILAWTSDPGLDILTTSDDGSLAHLSYFFEQN